MLRCTDLDEELEKNESNNENVLQYLLDAFRWHFPDEVNEFLRCEDRRPNSSTEGNQSLGINKYKNIAVRSKKVLKLCQLWIVRTEVS